MKSLIKLLILIVVFEIILGYAHKNNTCGLAGNMSCIKANIGDSDKDGNDDDLEKEINLCEF